MDVQRHGAGRLNLGCLLVTLLATAGCGSSDTQTRRMKLSDWYGICVDAPERATQQVHPRGIDSDVGEVLLDGAAVEYHVGFGLQGDFKRGRRIDLPHLSRGKVQVSFWEDPERTAFVVEGLRTDGARAHVWYVLDGDRAKSRTFAEELARKTDYCNPETHHE